MKSKFAPAVYAALRDAGFNNQAIAAQLGVSEAAVRRGLKGHEPKARQRQFLVTVEEL